VQQRAQISIKKVYARRCARWYDNLPAGLTLEENHFVGPTPIPEDALAIIRDTIDEIDFWGWRSIATTATESGESAAAQGHPDDMAASIVRVQDSVTVADLRF